MFHRTSNGGAEGIKGEMAHNKTLVVICIPLVTIHLCLPSAPVRVEKLYSATNDKGWPFLLLLVYDWLFEDVLRNILGSEFRATYEKPQIPEWQWKEDSVWKLLKEHRGEETTLSDLCDKIDERGWKVPVLVEEIPEGCLIRKLAKPFIWRNKLLAVGIRNWQMPTKDGSNLATTKRPPCEDWSESEVPLKYGPSKKLQVQDHVVKTDCFDVFGNHANAIPAPAHQHFYQSSATLCSVVRSRRGRCIPNGPSSYK
jgi:hypothetical protein